MCRYKSFLIFALLFVDVLLFGNLDTIKKIILFKT